MRKLCFWLVILYSASFISCKKDVRLTSSPAFTESEQVSAYGKINGQPFGIQVPGSNYCIGAIDDACNMGDAERLVAMALYVKDFSDPVFSFMNPTNKSVFVLYTAPYLKFNREDLFGRIFSVGEKQVGELQQQFYMLIKMNGRTYTTAGDQTGSHFRVEKVTEDRNAQHTLVWFSGHFKVYDTVTGEAAELTEARITANFSCY
jgi:hypothetical protein